MSNRNSIESIPDIDKVREQTVVGAVNANIAMHKWKNDAMERANNECNQKIAKKSGAGEKSASCDTWISSSYIAALHAKGYETKLIDPCYDGEGGRLSSVDVLESPHYVVSWGDK